MPRSLYCESNNNCDSDDDGDGDGDSNNDGGGDSVSVCALPCLNLCHALCMVNAAA
jgi:hypothetical protein